MQLVSARIQNYRSIEDSGVVPIGDVTCLVGKNESGKTAFLQALHLLNPINPLRGKRDFNDVMDYPSKRYSKYKKTRDEDPATVITATFELDDEEVKIVEADLGDGVLRDRSVVVSKGYRKGYKTYFAKLNERVAIQHLTKTIEAPAKAKTAAAGADSIRELIDALSSIAEPHSTVTDLLAELNDWRDGSLSLHMIDTYWDSWLPRFFYFDDYSTMAGRVSLPALQEKKRTGTLDEHEKTFYSLLNAVDADMADFDTLDFEALTRELEGAANGITEEVFAYWRQNPGLRVTIQTSAANPEDEPPLDVGPIVNVRIYNPRHAVTVPFDERSRGFIWFFSFFSYFNDLEVDDNRTTVLLLDEPGLSLHASAQSDVLSFIEERLAPDHQVIYTTHSPFLVDPRRLDRVRTVQDVDDEGTKIWSDALRTDAETAFPLQTALGYELTQTLFVAPNCLVVEGPADILYLQLLSQACEDAGKTPLDPAWVITPVGGADKVSTFVSLLGANDMNLAVLLDADSDSQHRLTQLQKTGYLTKSSVILVNEFTSTGEADLEDLFALSFYCGLVSGAYADRLSSAIKVGDLVTGDRIVKRVEQFFADNGINGGRLNHYTPAIYFLRNQAALLPKLNATTLDRASALFERVNGLLTTS